MKNELKRIEKLYLDGLLFEDCDEGEAGGYWDLAGTIADDLVDCQKDEIKHEQLWTDIYQVFQKVLVRGEKFE